MLVTLFLCCISSSLSCSDERTLVQEFFMYPSSDLWFQEGITRHSVIEKYTTPKPIEISDAQPLSLWNDVVYTKEHEGFRVTARNNKTINITYPIHTIDYTLKIPEHIGAVTASVLWRDARNILNLLVGFSTGNMLQCPLMYKDKAIANKTLDLSGCTITAINHYHIQHLAPGFYDGKSFIFATNKHIGIVMPTLKQPTILAENETTVSLIFMADLINRTWVATLSNLMRNPTSITTEQHRIVVEYPHIRLCFSPYSVADMDKIQGNAFLPEEKSLIVRIIEAQAAKQVVELTPEETNLFKTFSPTIQKRLSTVLPSTV